MFPTAQPCPGLRLPQTWSRSWLWRRRGEFNQDLQPQQEDVALGTANLKISGSLLKLVFFWVFLIGYSIFSVYAQNITRNQPIRDGETIMSPGGEFAFGFFSPGGSDFRYVGIWYNEVGTQSVVWVANRERPISGDGGVVAIGEDGNLVITERNGEIIWSSNVTIPAGSNSTAHLKNTGKLVLTANEKSTLWNSFNHPTDTFLPAMAVHMNRYEGEKHLFTSWKSATDPSPGNYSMGVDPRGSPQIVIWKGVKRHWRSGHWNGLSFLGVPEVRPVFLFGFELINEGNDSVYFTYTPMNSSDFIKFQINWEGIGRQESWSNESSVWNLIHQHPVDECDWYNHCGVFAKCSQMDRQRCSCIEGFVPRDSSQWGQGHWSNGCTRRMELQRCVEGSVTAGKTDGFVEVQNVKLPDYLDDVRNQDIEECRKMCLQNCSCTAYAVVSGINCMIWSSDLVDVRQFEQDGNTLYIRVAHTELDGSGPAKSGDGSKQSGHAIKIAGIVIGSGALLLGLAIFLILKRRAQVFMNILPRRGSRLLRSPAIPSKSDHPDETAEDGLELPIYDLNTLVIATNNFIDANKLGTGGFGSVYKGVLAEGQEIAVKRLSKTSVQGMEEFKNELKLIARLQHRNLVRLLGCCAEIEEKMLVYEYLENKSLDSILFKRNTSSMLEWQTRFNIICGIARGLLYLHQDSRFRIIHRDLKASNILLDKEMIPKISDFGMARIFGGDQTEANTRKVVGTYGYMSPEYAMEGLFSIKSDVFSFGVLVLEIVSGTMNRGFYQINNISLLEYAWKLHGEGRALELIDSAVGESYSASEAMRCIKVGLLCVQQHPEDRPNMSNIVLMLSSEVAVSMPRPKHPGYYLGRRPAEAGSGVDKTCTNQLTVTIIDDGR